MGGPGWTRGAAAEQNAAALACGRCPALAECWQYQHEYPESAGAHAGLTDSERKAKQ
ncbi:WhiB family transcriptional regulator [Arthrobacter sp. PL16]|uniref:WhiB family transcriptional regulator n=1 Tax=Arthrobacter sp. PL16 TaxID=3071720 RepID=UPI003FA35B61